MVPLIILIAIIFFFIHTEFEITVSIRRRRRGRKELKLKEAKCKTEDIPVSEVTGLSLITPRSPQPPFSSVQPPSPTPPSPVHSSCTPHSLFLTPPSFVQSTSTPHSSLQPPTCPVQSTCTPHSSSLPSISPVQSTSTPHSSSQPHIIPVQSTSTPHSSSQTHISPNPSVQLPCISVQSTPHSSIQPPSTPGAGALVPPLSPSLLTGGVSDENLEFCRMALRATPYLDVLTLPMGRGMVTPVMLRSGKYFCWDCSDCGCDPQCSCGQSHTGRCTCKLECDCPGRRFPSLRALQEHRIIHRTTRKYSVNHEDESESPRQRLRLS